MIYLISPPKGNVDESWIELDQTHTSPSIPSSQLGLGNEKESPPFIFHVTVCVCVAYPKVGKNSAQ
jgi:hypothetical protein